MGSAFTVVLNTNPYTYLGNIPFDVAPEATLDRGLVVLAVERMDVPHHHAARGGGRCPRAARRSGGSPSSTTAPTSAECRVVGRGPFPYQVDGDHLGDIEELVFRHEPDVLDLVLPV